MKKKNNKVKNTNSNIIKNNLTNSKDKLQNKIKLIQTSKGGAGGNFKGIIKKKEKKRLI